MTSLLTSLTISADGLTAQSGRLSNVAQNVANADTPGYHRKLTEFVTFSEAFGEQDSLRLGPPKLDSSALREIYDPTHPLADENGIYLGSNVNLSVEMADSREAARSYEANLRSFDNARQMTRALFDLLKR